LPVGIGVIEVAYAHALVEHLTDPAAVFGELRRVLRGRGLPGRAAGGGQLGL
jgi:hypothetical protein